MEQSRISKMSENVARSAASREETPLEDLDQALDTMLAAIGIIEESIPKIKTESVPERASIDTVKDLMDTAIKPYFADILKAMQAFGGE